MRAALIDRDGNLLTAAKGPSANPFSVGWPAAIGNLRRVVRSCLNQLPSTVSISKSAFALAGLSTRRHATTATRLLHNAFPKEEVGAIVVTNDTFGTLWGSAHRLPAVALVAGTGSHCLGISSTGSVTRCLGLEYALSDEGSSYYIGDRVLRAIVRSCDGRSSRATILPELAYSRLNIKSLSDLFEFVYRGGRLKQRVAMFARLATKAATLNDQLALEIIDDATSCLGEAVRVVATSLRIHNTPFELFLIGGLLQNSQLVRTQLAKRIADHLPLAKPHVLRTNPAIGAALIARDLPPYDIWACYETSLTRS